MDRSAVLLLPHPSQHPLELDRAEVEAAVALVEGGSANRVRLVGLRRPEAIASVALALTQAHHLAFEAGGHDEGMTLTIGPRLR